LESEPSYKPSLRYVEHALISGGREEELENVATQVAKALGAANTTGGECAAPAQLPVRLRMRAGNWDGTRDMAELAAAQTDVPLWALRLVNAHARAAKEDERIMMTTLSLVPRTNRPMELACLHLRAGEAAGRMENLDMAR